MGCFPCPRWVFRSPKYNAFILYLVTVLSDNLLVTVWIGGKGDPGTRHVLMPGDGPVGHGRTAGLALSGRWPEGFAYGPGPSPSTYASLTSLMLPPFCPNAPGMTDYRVEKDFLGELKVPKEAYWGAQTQRAIENFPISGIRFGRRFLYALGVIKMAAAQTNMELGLLDSKIGKAIVQACQEVMEGKLDAHFPLDVFQTGSGTSTNMNANEVIGNRANEILGHALGEKGPIHPNDHVNMGQSSNDVIPTAIHVAALMEIDHNLLPALREASGAIRAVAVSTIKIANDLRWLGSGPHTGLRELNLPPVQPGSSIMPGKVNPVIPEAVMQVGVTVIGNDMAIAVANSHSNLDLCTMMTVMSQRLSQNIELLANVSRVFAHRCIEGISANIDVLQRYAESSPAIATTLNLLIGYEKAAEIAKESGRTGKTVKQLVIEKGILTPEEAEKVLDPRHLTTPSKDLLGGGGG